MSEKKQPSSQTAIRATCVVCKKEKDIADSLRLTKDNKGKWRSNPVCKACRAALIADAREAGMFVPFFSLEASEREAEKRNEQSALNRPFLEKFAKLREKPAPKQAAPAKVVGLAKKAS